MVRGAMARAPAGARSSSGRDDLATARHGALETDGAVAAASRESFAGGESDGAERAPCLGLSIGALAGLSAKGAAAGSLVRMRCGH